MDNNTEKNHTYYMNLALKEAQKAFTKGEVPVGAIIVAPDGTVITRAHNLVEARYAQCAHAEALAIAKAGKKLHNWRLLGCSMYVTLEPCGMCMALICMSRMDKLIFGASSPLFGYRVYKNNSDIDKNESFTILEGICAEKSGNLLKKFFKKKRDA